jgi:outer membrane protein TolC
MRALVLTVFAALALGSQVHALELTVEQCVELGLKNNHTLKAQQAMVESSRQDTRIARSAYMPTLTAQGNYTVLDQPERVIIEKDVFGQGFPPSDTKIEDESTFYGAGLTLRQTLYAGGRINHTYQRDNELLTSAQHQFGSRQTQLAYELKRTFYEILIHRQYIHSYTQQVAARKEGLRITKALVAEGQLGEDRIDQARAKLMFSEAGLMETEQRAANELDRLRRLMAIDNYAEISLIEEPTYPRLKNTSPDLSAVAIGNREDLKQLDAQIKAAEESLLVAKSRYQPEIYLQGGYQRQRETNLTRADTWGASINFDWPLFEGGKTDAEVIKAKTEQQRLKDLRHDLTAAIRNEVLAAQRRVEQKQLLVDAYRVNLQAEERIYRDLYGRRIEGEVTVVEQAEQKALLLMAQANYLESINQLRIAVAALEAALAAPVADQLDLNDIYQPRLSRNEWPPQAPAASTVSQPVQKPPEKYRPATLKESSSLATGNIEYVVQLGAFKSQKRALAFIKTLENQYPDMKFETVAANGFHKVRSMPLQSHAAAASTLEAFNGKGFIVRANTSH